MKILDNVVPDELLVELSQVCSPLKEIGIHLFDYVRAYNNGKRICLCNRPEWLAHFYKRGFHQSGTFEGPSDIYTSGYILHSTLPFQNIFQEAREYFKIDNGITITKPAKDFCEFFFFSSTPDNPQIINFYLNNIDLLDRFILFFRDKGDNIIKQAEKYPIILPQRDTDIVEKELDLVLNKIDKENKLRDNFIKQTHINNYHFYLDQANIKLSKSEMKCLVLLLKGMSATEISKILCRSTRTVENHINNIKIKLDCNKKSELIDSLLVGNNIALSGV